MTTDQEKSIKVRLVALHNSCIGDSAAQDMITDILRDIGVSPTVPGKPLAISTQEERDFAAKAAGKGVVV